jgi:hypothetical protein
VLHLLINLLSVTPMLEAFEAEHGTITSLALFFGGELSGVCGEEEQRDADAVQHCQRCRH